MIIIEQNIPATDVMNLKADISSINLSACNTLAVSSFAADIAVLAWSNAATKPKKVNNKPAPTKKLPHDSIELKLPLFLVTDVGVKYSSGLFVLNQITLPSAFFWVVSVSLNSNQTGLIL